MGRQSEAPNKGVTHHSIRPNKEEFEGPKR
jgi:hypothetical protein